MARKVIYPVSGLLLIVVGMLVGFKIKDTEPDYPPIKMPFSGNLEKIEEVMQYVHKNYFEEVKEDKMVEDAIGGIMRGLDPHTFYIPVKEMQAVEENMQGSFEGIGVEFNILDDTILVVSPINGGPSQRLGIMSGDRIVKIDGENAAGIGITNQQVIGKLRGKKGTVVTVSIKRPGERDLFDVKIERDKIPLNSLDYSFMIDKENGYIKVNRFSETTVREFMEALTALKGKGMKNLVLDLRNNPGGYLEMAKIMSDVFLKQGQLIVYTEGRVPATNKRYEATSRINDFEEGGLVILINQGSASASEIVSGAAQDWDRGLIVGNRSFGKGLVQQQYELSDGSAIRVVVSRYFTPSGRCIQKDFNKDEKEYENEVYDRYESGEIFHEDELKFPDSLKFKTNSGRLVYGGGGIMPDVYVRPDTTGTSQYLTKLLINRSFDRFAFRYLEQHPELKTQYSSGDAFCQKFQVSEAILRDFTRFAAENSVPTNEKDLQKSRKYILNNIKAMLGRAMFNDDGYYPCILAIDPVFSTAVELMPDAVKLQQTGKFKSPKAKGKKAEK